MIGRNIRLLLSKQKSTKTKRFFKEPLPHHFEVLNHGVVPPKIQRPNYILNKNHDYEKKEYAIHSSEKDIDSHRKSCKITAKVLQSVEDYNSQFGFSTTEEIDKIVHESIVSYEAYPTAIGYMGFPKSVCTSTNEIAVHGIPNTRKLLNGDMTNVDVTSFKFGFHGDSSIMIFKGKPHEEMVLLSNVTREAMYKAIKYCKPNENVSTIGKVICDYVESKGFTVVKEFCGHGLGKDVHMNPYVFHFNNDIPDKMRPGMTFTIEPICCYKPYKELFILDDQWSMILPPDNPSAQWEHTVLITNEGHEILTFRDKEVVPDIYK